MSSFMKFFSKKEKTDKPKIKIKSKFTPKRKVDQINETIKPIKPEQIENDNSCENCFQGCKSYTEDINLDNLSENCYQVCKTCKTDSEAIKNDNSPDNNPTKNCIQGCKSFTEEIKFDNVKDDCFELCCTSTENISVKSWIIEKTNIFDDILGLLKEFSLYMKCNDDIQLQLEYLKSQRNKKKINQKLYITTLNRLDKIQQEPLNVPYLVCCKPYKCTGNIVEISNLTCNTKCSNPFDPKGPVPPDAIATCYDKSNERLCGDSTLPYFSALNDQYNDVYSKIEG